MRVLTVKIQENNSFMEIKFKCLFNEVALKKLFTPVIKESQGIGVVLLPVLN